MLYAWIENGKVVATDDKKYVKVSEYQIFEDLTLDDVEYLTVKNNQVVDIRKDSELLSEYISRKKKELLNRLSEFITSYIFLHYPDTKQKSDLADKEFFTTLLISKLSLTADEIANKVYEASANILSNTSTLQDEVNKLSKDETGNEITFTWNGQTIHASFVWEQLIKVGVRTGWVQLVKQKYYEIKSQIENLASLNEVENFKVENSKLPPFPKI